MASSDFSKQVARLRDSIVLSQLLLAFACVLLAFILAWNSKPGYPWFLSVALVLAISVSVPATCSRVSPSDLLGFAKITNIKDMLNHKDAA